MGKPRAKLRGQLGRPPGQVTEKGLGSAVRAAGDLPAGWWAPVGKRQARRPPGEVKGLGWDMGLGSALGRAQASGPVQLQQVVAGLAQLMEPQARARLQT